jgi:outer membrane lipoprotein-sorting protein
MKKILAILILAVAFMLAAGEKVKMSSVIGGEIFKNGFSATVKTTSDIPMMPVQEPYTIYTDGGGNSRTDMKDNISIYVEENGKDMMYNYDKKTKTYTVMSFDGMPGNMEAPGGLDEEEMLEKIGTATFAGVKCDKYRVIDMEEDDEEEMEAESYMYIDPAKKMFVGMEMKTGPYTMKMEYTNIKPGVDKSVFKQLPGYKKVEGFPMGGFGR